MLDRQLEAVPHDLDPRAGDQHPDRAVPPFDLRGGGVHCRRIGYVAAHEADPVLTEAFHQLCGLGLVEVNQRAGHIRAAFQQHFGGLSSRCRWPRRLSRPQKKLGGSFSPSFSYRSDNSLAIRVRWISFAPSTIWLSFASLISLSTLPEERYPRPPMSWVAEVVTFIARSVTYTLAAEI